MNRRMIFAVGLIGGIGCLVLFLVSVWIVGTIREEAAQMRKSVTEVKEGIPGSGIQERIDQSIEDGTRIAERMMEALQGQDNDQDIQGSLIGEMFRTGQHLSSELDSVGQGLFQLQPDEISLIGEQLHRDILKSMSIIQNPNLDSRIRRLAAPFTVSNGVGESFKFRFFVFDDPQVNAFSHIGGYVYVSTGILGFSQSDEELQFVLGHEIAHIKLGHCTAQITYAAQASKMTGKIGEQLVQLGYQAIASGYSEVKEFAADDLSCREVPSCRTAAIRFLSRLEKVYPDGGAERRDSRRVLSDGEELAWVFEEHFRTHPNTQARIDRLR